MRDEVRAALKQMIEQRFSAPVLDGELVLVRIRVKPEFWKRMCRDVETATGAPMSWDAPGTFFAVPVELDDTIADIHYEYRVRGV